MDERKFFKQVMMQLPKNDNVNLEITGEEMLIRIGDNNGFHLRKSGGVTCEEKTIYDDEFHKCYDAVVKTVDMIKEYMYIMDDAPDLKAIDFNMPYRKLLEFNGVVLGGAETKSGEYNFTTWSYANNSLYHGHYYGKNYQAAKEDFATRSGIVNANKLLSKEELVEVSKYVSDALECYELTYERKKVLEGMQEKIKAAIPEIDDLLAQSAGQDFEQTL